MLCNLSYLAPLCLGVTVPHVDLMHFTRGDTPKATGNRLEIKSSRILNTFNGKQRRMDIGADQIKDCKKGESPSGEQQGLNKSNTFSTTSA